LREEGFAKLPRRRDEERPAGAHLLAASVADARQFDLAPREFRTRFGGLFLFVPMLVALDFDRLIQRVGLPGTKMIPAAHALRSLLALKLFGSARHSHVMSSVFDEGLAFFAGLNAIPKRSFLTEYSCRIQPVCYPKLMQHWFDAMTRLGLERGVSFHLDFHTIPFHGEDALVEKHYVSKRSRRQKGVLAFLAQDADRRVFCYANADLRKDQQNDEILRFVEFWKSRTGRLPEELIFDSKLTTYANLDALNRMGIRFITLRRRTEKLLEEIEKAPSSAWRRVELKSVSRAYERAHRCEHRRQGGQVSACRLPLHDRLVITENPVCGCPSVGSSALKGFDDSGGQCLQWTSGALGTRVDEQAAVGPALRHDGTTPLPARIDDAGRQPQAAQRPCRVRVPAPAGALDVARQ
jgi:hypothetical protein